MKLKLVDVFKSASGKVCQDSEFYTCTRNGKTYTGRICNPYKGEPTDAQKAVTSKFITVTKQVSMILKAGRGNDEYDNYAVAYASNPGRYDTLRGYIFGKLYNA